MKLFFFWPFQTWIRQVSDSYCFCFLPLISVLQWGLCLLIFIFHATWAEIGFYVTEWKHSATEKTVCISPCWGEILSPNAALSLCLYTHTPSACSSSFTDRDTWELNRQALASSVICPGLNLQVLLFISLQIRERSLPPACLAAFVPFQPGSEPPRCPLAAFSGSAGARPSAFSLLDSGSCETEAAKETAARKSPCWVHEKHKVRYCFFLTQSSHPQESSCNN